MTDAGLRRRLDLVIVLLSVDIALSTAPELAGGLIGDLVAPLTVLVALVALVAVFGRALVE
jgi:hypothetical protein